MPISCLPGGYLNMSSVLSIQAKGSVSQQSHSWMVGLSFWSIFSQCIDLQPTFQLLLDNDSILLITQEKGVSSVFSQTNKQKVKPGVIASCVLIFSFAKSQRPAQAYLKDIMSSPESPFLCLSFLCDQQDFISQNRNMGRQGEIVLHSSHENKSPS